MIARGHLYEAVAEALRNTSAIGCGCCAHTIFVHSDGSVCPDSGGCEAFRCRPLTHEEAAAVVAVTAVVEELRLRLSTLPHGLFTDLNGRPRPCPEEWPGGPCLCYRASVMAMLEVQRDDRED